MTKWIVTGKRRGKKEEEIVNGRRLVWVLKTTIEIIKYWFWTSKDKYATSVDKIMYFIWWVTTNQSIHIKPQLSA